MQQTRPLQLKDGANEIQLQGMPQQYIPSTLVVLEFQGIGNFTLGPVSYQQANFTSAAILSKTVGKRVNLKVRSNSGRQRSIEGTLEAVLPDNQLLLRKDNDKVALVRFQDLEETELLDGLPEGLNEKAHLAVSALADSAGSYSVRILFRTGGLGWNANHNAVYDEKAGKLTRFDSSVFVTNNSGASYHDAELHLLAGNIGQSQQDYGLESAGGGMRMMAAAAPRRHNIRQATAQTVGEHKLYTAPTKITILEGVSLQVPLFQATDVPVAREYFLPAPPYVGYQEENAGLSPVSIRLKLVNDSEHKLGNPLPAGEVSIYQPDSSDTLQLTGSATLDHVAAGEAFGLTIGTSSDIKAERKQVESYEETDGDGGDESGGEVAGAPSSPLTMGPPMGRVSQQRRVQGTADDSEETPKYRVERWEVTVHNFKTDRAVDVVVMENFPESHTVLESTHEFAQETSTRHAATVKVDAQGKTTLSYSVRIKVE